MIELQGNYNTAKVYTDNAEPSAIAQIQHLLNLPFMAGSTIRVMPDTHAGMGCTIGMTMTITDKIVPNFVGVDINCAMTTARLNCDRVELKQLDKVIHQLIPAGTNVRSVVHHYSEQIDLTKLRCAKHVNLDRAYHSIGTLGGGNHFIELGQDEDKQLYLIVHSGSRNLGKQVCEHYQKIAADTLGRRSSGSDRMLAYLEGENMADYLHDMEIVQRFAELNRNAIVYSIVKQIKSKIVEQFSTMHNYIDLDTMILRKGAVSAQEGERILVPMNMRDGSVICVGKGNPDWNYSAPHGAGRVMSRTEAKANITLTQYEKAMEGIYSTTVSRATLDEAPFAYKPMQEVLADSSDTMTVVKTIKPLYNFKAAE